MLEPHQPSQHLKDHPTGKLLQEHTQGFAPCYSCFCDTPRIFHDWFSLKPYLPSTSNKTSGSALQKNYRNTPPIFFPFIAHRAALGFSQLSKRSCFKILVQGSFTPFMQGLISSLQHPSFYLQIHLVTLPHSNLFSEYKHNVISIKPTKLKQNHDRSLPILRSEKSAVFFCIGANTC